MIRSIKQKNMQHHVWKINQAQNDLLTIQLFWRKRKPQINLPLGH